MGIQQVKVLNHAGMSIYGEGTGTQASSNRLQKDGTGGTRQVIGEENGRWQVPKSAGRQAWQVGQVPE